MSYVKDFTKKFNKMEKGETLLVVKDDTSKKKIEFIHSLHEEFQRELVLVKDEFRCNSCLEQYNAYFERLDNCFQLLYAYVYLKWKIIYIKNDNKYIALDDIFDNNKKNTIIDNIYGNFQSSLAHLRFIIDTYFPEDEKGISLSTLNIMDLCNDYLYKFANDKYVTCKQQAIKQRRKAAKFNTN